MEEEIRKTAILRYIKGESPKAIYESLERSKHWFFKQLKRYQSGKSDWYKEKSRAPLRKLTKINNEVKQFIVSIRKPLESEFFAQIGVSAINWELHKLGLDFPSDRTINRILKREGLVKKNSYKPKGVEYPYFREALTFNNIHQVDLLGSRYIKGDDRFYSISVIDLFSHQVFIESQRTKDDRQVAFSLLRCCKTVGMPDFL